jgi:hypothetical protein
LECFYYVIIIVGVRGAWNNKGEKKLLIANVKGEFDQDVFAINNNFIIEYEQHLETS